MSDKNEALPNAPHLAQYALTITGTEEEIRRVARACELLGRVCLGQMTDVTRCQIAAYWQSGVTDPAVEAMIDETEQLLREAERPRHRLDSRQISAAFAVPERHMYSLWKGIPYALAQCEGKPLPDDYGVFAGRVTIAREPVSAVKEVKP